MGKQINFYMSENVQKCFLECIERKGFVFLDSRMRCIDNPYSTEIYNMYLFKPEYGEIIPKQENIIDCIKSPVMQLSKTVIKYEERKILRGRLWISDSYNINGKVTKKNQDFIKDYHMLQRWIKKNVPQQEIRKGDYIIKENVNNELLILQNQEFLFTL